MKHIYIKSFWGKQNESERRPNVKPFTKTVLILFIFHFSFFDVSSYAQTAKERPTKLKKLIGGVPLLKKGITVSGSITGNHVFYEATGIPRRAVPLNILYTGNVTVDILGKIKMPVSFSLSNQSVNFSHPFDQNYRFQQPFNRLLLKPTYKGFTLHIGTAAMTFSPFTLSGHRFEGLGMEYKNPKKPFYAGFMMGNLQRAVRIDSTPLTNNNRTPFRVPSYKRTGMGFQLGYKKQENIAEIIFFTAADQLNSLPYNLDDRNILPMQNTVMAFKGAKLFNKKIMFSTELALSGITNDSRAGASTLNNTLFRTFFGTFDPKTSTDFRKAFKTELLYRAKTFSTGIKYSRVDPNYQTLGAYFFVNDLETIDAKVATQLLKGKLTLSSNIGIQQDNVLKQKLKTTKRTVGMLNIGYVPSEKINLMLNYSNFTNFSNLRSTYDYLTRITPYNALDTINFRQINQNLVLGATFILPSSSKEIVNTLLFNGIFQRGEESQGTNPSSNNLTNLSLDYSYNHSPKKLMITSSLTYSKSAFNNLPMSQWGPALSINKGIGNKWRANANLLYSLGKTNGGDALSSQDRTLNARCGLTGKVNNKLNVLFNLIYLDRQATSSQRYIPNFHEFTATLGLSYNFTVLKLAAK